MGIVFASGDSLRPPGAMMGVMFRMLIFPEVSVLAAAGAQTVLRSPDWLNWKLALVAGGFGHGLTLLGLARGGAAWAF